MAQRLKPPDDFDSFAGTKVPAYQTDEFSAAFIAPADLELMVHMRLF